MQSWADDPKQPWRKLIFDQFGLHATLLVKTVQALYYKAGKDRLLTTVLVRDAVGKRPDQMFYCTRLDWNARKILSNYSARWSIEVVFKASKQVMKIQSPQHWCQASVKKLSPWVWLMRSAIGLWYFSDGRKLPAAQVGRRRFGEWETEWSLAHMLRIRRTTILEATISPESATEAELYQLLDDLENCLNLAA
jgi:hypothetical protein